MKTREKYTPEGHCNVQIGDDIYFRYSTGKRSLTADGTIEAIYKTSGRFKVRSYGTYKSVPISNIFSITATHDGVELVGERK